MALIDPIIQFQKERASVPFQPPTLCTAETFPLLLAGVPALRKTPGLATLEDAGEAYFTSIPYCLSGEDRQATRDHLEQVYGITNRDSMVAFCKEALLTNHEYLDFESFWEGRPSFSLEDLSPDARPVFQRLSDFARQFQPLVGRRGFLAWDISETPGHKRIASRIHTILPQTSVVGMLMEHEKRYQVVHSTYDGLYQHDGFSWQVLGTQFVHLDDFSREGKLVDETLSSWADSLNTQQREALADALYSVFTASGAKTLSELTEEKLKSAAAMLKTYKNLDRETRRMVTEAFMLFFKLGTKNFVLDTQEESSREIENIRKKISEQYQKLVERKK